MKKGDKFYQIADGENPFSSANTLLVCTLLSLGAELYEDEPFSEYREIVDGKPQRSIVWRLKEMTRTGAEVKNLAQQWRDHEWIKANPESAMAYIKEALENYRKLVNAIKTNVPMNVVRHGKKFALIPEDATEAQREELLKKL